jgi:hypothetical protein
MQCPIKLIRNGNSAQGNFLMAQFDKSNPPAAVRIVIGGVPTTDIQPTNGNSGVWQSKQKYTSLEVTLDLLDELGNLINSCNYDISGQPSVGKECTIENAVAKKISGSASAEISWKSTKESKVQNYIVEREHNREGYINPLISYPKGAGSSYIVIDADVSDVASSYKYRISVVFEDNSNLVLIETPLTELVAV